MKTIDLNFDLQDLNGNPVQGNPHAGQFIAGLMMSQTKGDAVKFFDWAMSLNKKESIIVDDSDFSKIKSLISDSEHTTLLAKAQILKKLDSIK
jgi:hypothetical protein